MCSFSTHRTWPARNIVISFWPSRLLSSCGRNSTSPARPCSGLTAVSRKCRGHQAPMGRLRTGRRRTEEGPMADRRFFDNAGPFALSELATIAEAELAPGADGARRFADVAPLDVAGPDDVGFLDNRRYLGQFAESKAGACIVSPELAERAPAGMQLLLDRKSTRLNSSH